MEPVELDVPRAAAHRRADWAVDRRGRPAAAGRALAPPPARGPRGAQPAPPGEVRRDRGARGPPRRRAPRGRRPRDRRLRDRRPRRPDAPSRGPATPGCGPGSSGRSRCGRSRAPRCATLAARVAGVLVVELSAGQMVEDVRLAVEGRVPVAFTGRTGGMVPTPDEVVGALLRDLGDVGRRQPGRRSRPMSVAIPEGARVVFGRPELLADRTTHYCPGCGHGVVHRLIAEVLGELGLGPADDRRRPGRLRGLRLRLPRASTSSRRRTAARPPSRPASGASARTPSSSPTRATATSPRSAPARSSTPPPAASSSPPSSSTTASTG